MFLPVPGVGIDKPDRPAEKGEPAVRSYRKKRPSSYSAPGLYALRIRRSHIPGQTIGFSAQRAIFTAMAFSHK